MNHQTRIPPRHVPTLTEVVEIIEPLPVPEPGAVVEPPALATDPIDLPEPVVAAPASTAPGEPTPLEPVPLEPTPDPVAATAPLPVTPAPIGEDDAVPAFLRARPAPHLASALGAVDRIAAFEAANETHAPAAAAGMPPMAEAEAEFESESVGTAEAVLPAADDVHAEQITQRVLADMQRQIDLMLEYRLREALAPILARAADGIVKEARRDLATTLKDVVARAVAQELARQRLR